MLQTNVGHTNKLPGVLQTNVGHNNKLLEMLQTNVGRNNKLPGMLQTNVGHNNKLSWVLQTNVEHNKFGYRKLEKIISSDISAFEQGRCYVSWLRVKWWILDDFNRLKDISEFWPLDTCAP